MGSADEVNIQASELNRTMKVVAASPVNVLHDGKARQCRSRHALQCVHTDKCWLPVACMCRWVLFAVSIRIRPFVSGTYSWYVIAVQVINRFLSRFTGMTTDEIEVETDRDNFLGPQAAIEKGVIDRVLER